MAIGVVLRLTTAIGWPYFLPALSRKLVIGGVHSDGILKLWPVYDRIISGHRMVSGPMATSTTRYFFAVSEIE